MSQSAVRERQLPGRGRVACAKNCHLLTLVRVLPRFGDAQRMRHVHGLAGSVNRLSHFGNSLLAICYPFA